MHPRIHELLSFIDEQYAAFRATVEAVPADDRERDPGPGRWSVAQVIEHVAKVESVVGQRIGAAIAQMRAGGAPAETETSSIIDPELLARVTNRETPFTAPERAHPRPDVTFADAWAALEAAHAQLRATFASGDGLALGSVTGAHPVLGELTLYEWGVASGGHEARHAAQIREITAALAREQGQGATA